MVLGGREMGGRGSDRTVATLSCHCVLLGVVIVGRAAARNPARPPAVVLQVLRAPIRHAALGHARAVHLVLGDAHGDLRVGIHVAPGPDKIRRRQRARRLVRASARALGILTPGVFLIQRGEEVRAQRAVVHRRESIRQVPARRGGDTVVGLRVRPVPKRHKR